uniref:Pheromone receptor STE3.1 n=3 Tax=Phanerodontia chrysosporium TaxID=2822231 RepID=K8FK43_PHACR|nr:TPA_inf: pheromone receptor STE3.1 [Phanerochaete chrysosporium RP-78]
MLHAMPAAAFAAAAGLSLPFAAHRTLVRRQYLPVVAMALWLFFANVVYGVNALVWSGSYEVRIPVWCDITTKLLIAVAYGIPSCIVCIAARLRLAVVPRELPLERTPKELKDALILDLSLCVGMPIASMIIHTIVQEHRFDIVEDLGCQPEIPAVSAGTVFFWLPALVFALLALFQCCMSPLSPSRLQLHEHLALFDTTLTLSTFLSLLAAVLSIGALWAALLLLTVHEALRLPPGAVDWARVDTYAWDDFPAASQRTRRFCWWVYPAAALALTVCVAGLPALARLDVWAGTCARLHRRRSSITLRELRKGCVRRLRRFTNRQADTAMQEHRPRRHPQRLRRHRQLRRRPRQHHAEVLCAALALAEARARRARPALEHPVGLGAPVRLGPTQLSQHRRRCAA